MEDQFNRSENSISQNLPATPSFSEFEKQVNVPLRRGEQTGEFPVYPIQAEQTGHVDLATLLKAQARFIFEQTAFLRNSGRPGLSEEDYIQILLRYSHEQSVMAQAQAQALRQIGVY